MHDAPPPVDSAVSPPSSVAVIETDTYCERCGYNLRTQPVWRDSTLGIPVCRCPECGTHRAAGLATVGSLWGRRAATALLLAWVALCAAGVLSAAGLTLGLQSEAEGVLAYYDIEARDGRQLRRHEPQYGRPLYLPAGEQVSFVNGANGRVDAFLEPGHTPVALTDPPFVPAGDVVRRYHWADCLTGRTGYTPVNGGYSDAWQSVAAFGLVNVVAYGLFGLVMACVCWHWRARWRWAWALLPAAVFGLTLALADAKQRPWLPQVPTDRQDIATTAVLAVAAVQAVSAVLGLAVGRPAMRALVRLFVPRSARTPLAFLWTADGKTPPRAVV